MTHPTNILKTLGRTGMCSIALVLAIALGGLTTNVAAQADDEDNARYMVLSGDKVHMRVNAAPSYYAFAQLRKGDVVKVIGEKYGWARVSIKGEAFAPPREMLGLVRIDSTERGRFSVSGDGKTGVTRGEVRVYGLGLDRSRDPEDHWRAIAYLKADVELDIVESYEFPRKDRTWHVHIVRLPEQASGYVNMTFLRDATPEEISAFKAWSPDAPAALAKPEEAPPVINETTTEETTTTDDADEDSGSGASGGNRTADESGGGSGIDDSAEDNGSAGGDTRTADETPERVVIGGDDSTTTLTDDTDTTTTTTTEDTTTSTEDTTTNTETTDIPEAPEQSEIEKLRDTLGLLEDAFSRLAAQPMEDREIEPLRELYVELGSRSTELLDDPLARFANTRAEQLEIMSELQERKQELKRIRARIDQVNDAADATLKAIQNRADYTAVGRLASSTIFNGADLPRLLRLQDPATGRTIAYVRPTESLRVAGMLGQLIGIRGDRTYDPAVRLHVIEPERIDMLAVR